MTEFIKKIENVKSNEFTVDGVKWTVANYPNNRGTSARGLWVDMTDGESIKRIYKSDVLKVNSGKAIALFN